MTRKELIKNMFDDLVKNYNSASYYNLFKDYRKSDDYQNLSPKQKMEKNFDMDIFKEEFSDLIDSYIGTIKYDNELNELDE